MAIACAKIADEKKAQDIVILDVDKISAITDYFVVCSAINERQLHAIADVFAAPAGRSVAAMVAAAQSETELAKAFRNEFIARNRDAARQLLERSVGDGLVAAPADLDLALDMVFGALFYRLLMGHAPITRAFVDQLLDAVIPPAAPAAPDSPGPA